MSNGITISVNYLCCLSDEMIEVLFSRAERCLIIVSSNKRQVHPRSFHASRAAC